MTEYELKKLAGAGKIGDSSFGYFKLPPSVQKRQLHALKSHIGKRVYLTGGGSLTGAYSIGTLKKAELVPEFEYEINPKTGIRDVPKKVGTALQATLTKIVGEMAGHDPFEPHMGSWKISVAVPKKKLSKVL
jgi:hypothetical protein